MALTDRSDGLHVVVHFYGTKLVQLRQEMWIMGILFNSLLPRDASQRVKLSCSLVVISRTDAPAVLVSLASAGRAAEPGVCAGGLPEAGVLAPAQGASGLAAIVFGSCRAAFDDAPPMFEFVEDGGGKCRSSTSADGMTSNGKRPFIPRLSASALSIPDAQLYLSLLRPPRLVSRPSRLT